MESYKEEYNKLLNRWYKGLEYIEKHPDEEIKYAPELIKIQKRLENMIEIYYIKDEETILKGFKN